jgi:hypothetical protein
MLPEPFAHFCEQITIFKRKFKTLLMILLSQSSKSCYCWKSNLGWVLLKFPDSEVLRGWNAMEARSLGLGVNQTSFELQLWHLLAVWWWPILLNSLS